ncbi:MAG: TauD/TfdA family dioxygenase [Bacteroidota bacterium]
MTAQQTWINAMLYEKGEWIAKEIKNHLEETGYVLVRDFPIGKTNTYELFQNLCTAIGHPIGHDKAGTIIWDIKSKPPSSDRFGVITYSEHNHEADLHTDSQYSEYPEDYFALLTLKKAACGGGLSYLLSVADIVSELNESADGKKVLDIIQTTKYPFIVPNVFKKKSGDTPEFNFGYLLKGGKMRFRVDTIQKALNYDASFCTPEQIWAFDYLVHLVRNTQHTRRFHLEPGDLIFINNKTMLHGRSSFTDYDRHLLRIRMNVRETLEVRHRE